MADLLVRGRNDADAAERKIFVGGLSYNTDDEKLRKYFGAFGFVQDAVVMKDPTTKRSRGFGFITFNDVETVDIVLENEPHMIDSRKVEAKRAVPRTEGSSPSPKLLGHHSASHRPSPPLLIVDQAHVLEFNETTPRMAPEMVQIQEPSPIIVLDKKDNSSGNIKNSVNSFPSEADVRAGADSLYNKIFVGGLHYDTKDEDFRSYFEKFGKIVQSEVMFNRETHKSRGFGFVVFEFESGVEMTCAQAEHTINGKVVEVKRAIPRTKAGNADSTGKIGNSGHRQHHHQYQQQHHHQHQHQQHHQHQHQQHHQQGGQGGNHHHHGSHTNILTVAGSGPAAGGVAGAGTGVGVGAGAGSHGRSRENRKHNKHANSESGNQHSNGESHVRNKNNSNNNNGGSASFSYAAALKAGNQNMEVESTDLNLSDSKESENVTANVVDNLGDKIEALDVGDKSVASTAKASAAESQIQRASASQQAPRDSNHTAHLPTPTAAGPIPGKPSSTTKSNSTPRSGSMASVPVDSIGRSSNANHVLANNQGVVGSVPVMSPSVQQHVHHQQQVQHQVQQQQQQQQSAQAQTQYYVRPAVYPMVSQYSQHNRGHSQQQQVAASQVVYSPSQGYPYTYTTSYVYQPEYASAQYQGNVRLPAYEQQQQQQQYVYQSPYYQQVYDTTTVDPSTVLAYQLQQQQLLQMSPQMQTAGVTYGYPVQQGYYAAYPYEQYGGQIDSQTGLVSMVVAPQVAAGVEIPVVSTMNSGNISRRRAEMVGSVASQESNAAFSSRQQVATSAYPVVVSTAAEGDARHAEDKSSNNQNVVSGSNESLNWNSSTQR